MATPPGLDVLRSLVRSAAREAVARAREALPLDEARARLRDLVTQRTRLDEARLSAAVARVASVASASVVARGGALVIDAHFRDGTTAVGTLVPRRIAFAARGAKELTFELTLAPGSSALHVTDLVAALAEEIGAVLWSLGRRTPDEGPSTARVDRAGSELRVDLRSTRAARRLLGTPFEPLLDFIDLRALQAHHATLHIHLGFTGDRIPPAK